MGCTCLISNYYKHLAALAMFVSALADASMTLAQPSDKGEQTDVGSGGVTNVAKSSNSDWKVRLGAGAAIQPRFEGSADFRAFPLPFVDVTYNDQVFLSTENGLGFYLINSDSFVLGVSGNYAFGRDEKEDGRILRGLGDIDAAVRARLFGSYFIGPVELTAGVSRDLGGSEGFLADVGAYIGYPISPRLGVRGGVSATYADDTHMESFFGVSATQAARSVVGLPAFEAQEGFKRVDASLGAEYKLSDNWFIAVSGGVGFLIGDAKDSPITQEDTIPFGVVGVGYRF
jgi:MipA family protein